MKLHHIQVRNVRQIKEARLDLSSGLTVVTGPHGVGKTTVQKSIFGGMFFCKKEARDNFISRFDPHTAPSVVLGLSRGEVDATVELTRRLTDDAGQWAEGGTIVKQKGKALERIAAELPISDAAAALLLWGNQEDMLAVLDEFPEDGHSLLTAATIRGIGPDPKDVGDRLERARDQAKKGGKNPGPLTAAQNKVAELEEEQKQAHAAEARRAELAEKFEQAKNSRDQQTQLRKEKEAAVARLGSLLRALKNSLAASERLAGLEEKQAQWDGLAGHVRTAQRTRKDLQEELATLEAEYRVARQRELAEQLARLQIQLEEAGDVSKRRDEIDQNLRTTRRPGKADVQECRRIQEQVRDIVSRMEATGLRYRIACERESRTVHVAEDGGPSRPLELAPGQMHEAVVGGVAIQSDGLRITATGKEDIVSQKRSLERAKEELQALWKRFGVGLEEDFHAGAAEREQLEADLKDAKNELARILGTETVDGLTARLKRVRQELEEKPATAADEKRCAGKHLSSAGDTERRLIVKQNEVEMASRRVKEFEVAQPTPDQVVQMEADLRQARSLAGTEEQAFRAADGEDREPTRELLEEIEEARENQRAELGELLDQLSAAEKVVTGLAADLRHSGPMRSSMDIDADLQEARRACQRETVLQDARELLAARIKEKISEMAESVPRDLGARIGRHLARLTGGAYCNVYLKEDLTVTGVTQNGPVQDPWQPSQLSFGERHLVALAVKIAVARALSESNGPVFLVLDDSLAPFDPCRRGEAEKLLLDLVADGKLQVILFTCHSDWVADWKRRAGDAVTHIEMADVVEYYRPPAGMLHCTATGPHHDTVPSAVTTGNGSVSSRSSSRVT